MSPSLDWITVPETDVVDAGWTVVVPQKDLRLAKSRMALGEEDRRDIVVAMFVDTLDAIAACDLVDQVIVVCDSADDALALRRPGVIIQVNDASDGLNASIEKGASLARELLPETLLAVLPTDLPGIRPEELFRALALAADHDRAFIADAAGSGTTLLTAGTGFELRPAYGPSSRARHTLIGCAEIGRNNDLESLRDDVDDIEALRRVIASDRARQTRRTIAALRGDTVTGLRDGTAP